ncbi:MAG: hypothetical protein IJ446_06755 [Oscillospiraceae bacterium]|nr:hypothetical protein [Oscillospiraceae bacterium]
MTDNIRTPETEQEWRWCLVGNIVPKHEHGEEHIIKYGNKQFRPDAKVYINPVYAGMGHENIVVIGTPRHTSKYIEIAVSRRYVYNFRVQKVFKPAVLRKMKSSDLEWWGNTEKDHLDISEFAKAFNESAEEYICR